MGKLASLFAVCLLAAGCVNRTGNRPQAAYDEGVSLPENLPTAEELGGYPVTDRQVEIKEYYVTDRQGVDAKQEPDESSKTLLHYNFGDVLNVFVDPGRMYEALYYDPALYDHASSGVSPTFYAVGGSVYREWSNDEMNNTAQIWRYELVFVKRNALGDISDVRLIPEELNEAERWEAEERERWEAEERRSDGRLTVELVDQSVYDSMERCQVDSFSIAKASVPKSDGRIVLKTQAGEVAFEDEREDDIYFHLEGTYETLNQYVVSVAYEDYLDYRLVDKITGGILDLSGFPHVSPDRKYILCLYTLDTDGTPCAGMTLYEITDEREIIPIRESKYMNWGITDQGRDAFWGPDGCFYCKARHSKVNWEYNPNCEYLRIRLSGV